MSMTGVFTESDTMVCCNCEKNSPILETISCDSGAICYSCYCTDYNVCGHCGRVLPVSSLRPDGNGRPVCSDCVELVDAIRHFPYTPESRDSWGKAVFA